MLLTDNWDIWQVPVAGGTAVNLTQNGRKDQIRYQRRSRSSRRGAPASTSTKPQYFAAYGEWTKKAGIARLSPGKPGVEMLIWGDASYAALIKAKDAERISTRRRRRPIQATITSLTRASRRACASPISGRRSRRSRGPADRCSSTTRATRATSCRRRCSCPPTTRRARRIRRSSTSTRRCRRARTRSPTRPRTASTGRLHQPTATPCCSPTSPTR